MLDDQYIETVLEQANAVTLHPFACCFLMFPMVYCC